LQQLRRLTAALLPPSHRGLYSRPAMTRDRAIWYCYLMLGMFTYLLNIQGNIIPFLKSELGLSYRAVGLHSSAIAVGMIVVGLFGDRATRRPGRRRILLLSGGGASTPTISTPTISTIEGIHRGVFLLGCQPGAEPS